MIIRERYLQKIVDYMWDGQIKVITGIRRCGKSTLLLRIFADYLKGKGKTILHPESAALLEGMLRMLAVKGEKKTFAYIRKKILTKEVRRERI